jgi:hypothetical protein
LPDEFDLLVHELEEISFVPRGANKKEYLLVKEMKDDIILSLLQTPDEDLEKSFKEAKIGDEPREVLAIVGKFLKTYRDLLPAESMGILAKACGYPEPKNTSDEGGRKGDDTGDDEEGDKNNGEGYGYPAKGLKKEAFARLDPETQEFIKGLVEDNKTTKETVHNMKEDQLAKEYFAKAEELPFIPSLDPAKHSAVLKTLGESHPEEFAIVFNMLKEANALLAKSDAFAEVGRGGDAGLGSAEAIVYAKAKAMVQKDSELTFEAAVEKVLDQEPKLYEQYERERESRAVGRASA